MKEIIRDILLALIMCICLSSVLFYATVQESLRLCPPTSQEVADNPELARYLP